MNQKELLKMWGESTAYSSKCHFKMHDLERFWVYALISINILFAVFSLLCPDWSPKLAVTFSVLSLIASVLILIHESQSDKQSAQLHKAFGEEYLELHYRISTLFFSDYVSDEQLKEIEEKIIKLNKTPRPSINKIGKWRATRAIEIKGEVKKWWKND